jgi:hypothetical protein
MRFGLVALLVAVAWLASETMVMAAGPVAVVEEVTGKRAGIEFMDYVEAGKVIVLGSHDKIVLGYLQSCWRETITGGRVVVGMEQSEVQGGEVERVRVKCDGGKIQFMPAQAVQSAGTISRGLQSDEPKVPTAQLTLYARMPMIDVRGGTTLLVERLDHTEKPLKFVIQSTQLLRGRFFDFAVENLALTAGGVYQATLDAHEIVFKVDPAAPLTAPIVSSLLRF